MLLLPSKNVRPDCLVYGKRLSLCLYLLLRGEPLVSQMEISSTSYALYFLVNLFKINCFLIANRKRDSKK